MLTMADMGRIMAMTYYSRRRAMKARRKANPRLKHNPLHDMLRGKPLVPPGTTLRIRINRQPLRSL